MRQRKHPHRKKMSKKAIRKRINASILNKLSKHYFKVNTMMKLELNWRDGWKEKWIRENWGPLIQAFKGNNPRKFLDQHKLKLLMMLPPEDK